MNNIQVWPKPTGTASCGTCKTAMAVTLNEVYLFRDGNPIHDHHASPDEQQKLRAERQERQGDSGQRLKASRKAAFATAATAAQWVFAKASASRERHQ